MLADRHGARWLVGLGFTASIALLVCLRFVARDAVSDNVLLAVLMTLLSTALMAVIITPIPAEVTYAIESEAAAQPRVWGEKGVYGIAYGLFRISFSLGGTVGALVAGYIQAGSGWATVTWVLALCYVPSLAASSRPGGRPKQRRDNAEFDERVANAETARSTSRTGVA